MDVLSSTVTDFSVSDESDGDEDLDEWEKNIEAGMAGGKGADKLAKRDLKNLFERSSHCESVERSACGARRRVGARSFDGRHKRGSQVTRSCSSSS